MALIALALLIASVPVALPATFTLPTSPGAQELAKSSMLGTCLSSMEEGHRIFATPHMYQLPAQYQPERGPFKINVN
jgi:hypothetical protein